MLLVLPPVSTAGLTNDDVQTLANSVRDQMISTLKEISHPGPSEFDLESDDENVPLTSGAGAAGGESDISAGTGYGSIVEGGELRRRVSSNAGEGEGGTSTGNVKKEMREAGAVDDGPRGMGVAEAITGGNNGEGTEDEMDDEGAVLVRRPE